MKQKILDLNQNEREWVHNNLTAVKGIVQSTLGGEEADWLNPIFLDQAYKAWYSNHKRGSEDPNPLINAFGIAFGEYLIRELGFEWKLVKEKRTTEIAVYGETGNIILFPPNLVAKRYEKGIVDFFEPLFSEIKNKVVEVRQLHDD
jgi:hypothetical protein